MASKRRSILVAWLARLEAITRANGRNTDAGAHLYLGQVPGFGPDDPDQAIAVLVGDEVPGWQQGKVFIELPLEVQALVKVDPDDAQCTVEAQLAVEDVIEDIKRAGELEDLTLGGLLELNNPIKRGPVRSLPREAGSTSVGASLTYTVTFTEGWGAP